MQNCDITLWLNRLTVMKVSSVHPRHWALSAVLSLTAVTGVFLSASIAQASGPFVVPTSSAAASPSAASPTATANSAASSTTAATAANAAGTGTGIATGTATKVTTQNACAAPAPGQFGCLAIRRTDIAP